MTSPFEYRIVRLLSAERVESFMPQRGLPEGSDAIASRYIWRDGVPLAAPTLELAQAYVVSMQVFDGTESGGSVVWKTPTAP